MFAWVWSPRAPKRADQCEEALGRKAGNSLPFWADREVAVNAADDACDHRGNVPARKIGAIYLVRSRGCRVGEDRRAKMGEQPRTCGSERPCRQVEAPMIWL